MTEATYFVHKASLHKTVGAPLSAMLQCREPLEGNERFTLYQSLEGHGFFLRKNEEFAERFKAISKKAKNVVWTHKEKGGTYEVVNGNVMYVGSPSLGHVMDGLEMKAYFMDGNGVKDMLFCSAKQFAREFEPRYVVKWLDETYTYSKSVRVPFEPPKGLYYDGDTISISDSVTIYKDGPFYNALVSRGGKKDVRLRGEDLGLVVTAADTLLQTSV